MELGVVLAHIAVDHDSLGRALLADEQHGLVLSGDEVHQELGPDVVYVGHQDGSVLGLMVRWVGVWLHPLVPMLPAPWQVVRQTDSRASRCTRSFLLSA